jgi:hypothetical protein
MWCKSLYVLLEFCLTKTRVICSCWLDPALNLHGLLLNFQDAGSALLRNVSEFLSDFTHPTRYYTLYKWNHRKPWDVRHCEILHLKLRIFWLLYGGEWSASRSWRFTLDVGASGTHWIGAWMGPGSDLEGVQKWNIFFIIFLVTRSIILEDNSSVKLCRQPYL